MSDEIKNLGKHIGSKLEQSIKDRINKAVKAEREACAQVALEENERRLALASVRIPALADEIASAIRARSNKEPEQ